METIPDPVREMSLLEQIEVEPDVNQSALAARLGVAVGTINWHLKRLIAKGYVKVKRAERRKLKYIITPEGIAFRARLTVDYINQSMILYRNTRQRVIEHLDAVRQSGCDSVRILGDGDLAEIIRLTCIEHRIQITDDERAPVLEAQGVKVTLDLNGRG